MMECTQSNTIWAIVIPGCYLIGVDTLLNRTVNNDSSTEENVLNSLYPSSGSDQKYGPLTPEVNCPQTLGVGFRDWG